MSLPDAIQTLVDRLNRGESVTIPPQVSLTAPGGIPFPHTPPGWHWISQALPEGRWLLRLVADDSA